MVRNPEMQDVRDAGLLNDGHRSLPSLFKSGLS